VIARAIAQHFASPQMLAWALSVYTGLWTKPMVFQQATEEYGVISRL
jgi:hypothetical protein